MKTKTKEVSGKTKPVPKKKPLPTLPQDFKFEGKHHLQNNEFNINDVPFIIRKRKVPTPKKPQDFFSVKWFPYISSLYPDVPDASDIERYTWEYQKRLYTMEILKEGSEQFVCISAKTA